MKPTARNILAIVGFAILTTVAYWGKADDIREAPYYLIEAIRREPMTVLAVLPIVALVSFGYVYVLRASWSLARGVPLSDRGMRMFMLAVLMGVLLGLACLGVFVGKPS